MQTHTEPVNQINNIHE